jgi:Protein of Unknown function (DUF2784)
VVHGALVVFMLVGALFAVRWPRLAYFHAPVGLAILGINLAGSDCPVTWVELNLRARAGVGPYTGGFLGHYAYQPLGLDAHQVSTQVLIYTVALVPQVIGYGLLLNRRLSRGRVRPAAPAPAPAPAGEA